MSKILCITKYLNANLQLFSAEQLGVKHQNVLLGFNMCCNAFEQT